MIPFLDISSHQQGPVGIDWPAVAAYLLAIHPEAGVIVKVSEGTDYVNPFLHPQRMGAHAAGLKNVGLYHFSRASRASGHAEADWFMQCVGDDGGVLKGEFPCLDLEDTLVPAHADLDAYNLDYAGRIQRPWGVKLVDYTGAWYADPHNLNRDPRLAELLLWWAAIQPELPPTPEPWRSAGQAITLWQYDWHGSIPGIVGDVDLDWLVGPIETLRPAQWGFEPDPLGGKLIAGEPDIALTDKGAAVDVTAAAVAIARDVELARRLYGTRGNDLDTLLATAQADASAIALVSGLLP